MINERRSERLNLLLSKETKELVRIMAINSNANSVNDFINKLIWNEATDNEIKQMKAKLNVSEVRDMTRRFF